MFQEFMNEAFNKLKEKNYPLVFISKNKVPFRVEKGEKNHSKWQQNPVNGEKQVHHQARGLGLITGEPSGIIALDLDSTHPETKEKIKKILGKHKDVLKCGRLGNKEKIGALFFKKPKWGIDKKEIFKNASIEILSTGQQVVLPPSEYWYQPTNKEGQKLDAVQEGHYKWNSTPLWEFKADDLPEFPQELFNDLASLEHELSGDEQFQKEKREITAAKGRCSHGSYQEISSLAVALMHEGHPLPEITRMILEKDSQINPDVSFFQCPQYKASRKLKQEFDSKDANALYFLLDMFERRWRDKEIEQFPLQDSYQVDFEKIGVQPVKEDENSKLVKLEGLTGVCQQIFDYVYATSPVPRAKFAYPSSLVLISTLIAGKVTLDGVHPKLYSIIVGASGTGKGEPLEAPIKLLLAANLQRYLGDSDIPSKEGFTLAIAKRGPSLLYAIDEGHSLFDPTSKAGSSGLRDRLAAFYTTKVPYQGETLATHKDGKEPRGKMDWVPQPNLFAATTPESFREVFKSQFFKTGLGSRILFFIDTKEKKRRKYEIYPQEKIDKLVENLKMISREINFEDPNAPFSGEPRALKKTPEAQDFIAQCALEIEEETMQYKLGSVQRGIMNRKFENFLRIAMIIHASSEPQLYIERSIELKTVQKARKIADSIFHNQIIQIPENIFDSERERHFSLIENYIKERNDKGVTMQQVHNNFSKRIETKRRKEIINSLTEAGTLVKNDGRFYIIKTEDK